MTHEYLLAEVKAVKDAPDGNGMFEAVISTPTLDRDGEVVAKGAFEPLPTSIPIHAFHDFHDPVGRAEPFYDSEGVLRARGIYASTPRAQEIRALVLEGVIGHMSVGFMGAERDEKDGVPHIVKGELLEASFVSVPSNRQAALTLAKEWAAKAGARNSMSDAQRLQQIHDLTIHNGAKCPLPDGSHDSTRGLDDGAVDVLRRFGIVASDDKSLAEQVATALAAFNGLTEKSTDTDPEPAPAPVAAAAPADVTVARARAHMAQGLAALI